MKRIVKVASKLGEPEEVLASALRKETLTKLVEMEAVVRAMERKCAMVLKGFEERGMVYCSLLRAQLSPPRL